VTGKATPLPEARDAPEVQACGHTGGLTCGNAARREGARSGPQRPDMQVQRSSGTSAVAGLKDFASEVGIPAASLVNAQIKEMLRRGEARFTTSLEPTPYLEGLMREAEADYAAGRNISPAFDSVDDMFDHLEKTAQE
jgi:hypothetical protein